MTKQLAWLIGLASCVAGALIGQAELLGEPWRHYATVGFVVGTAISGYMLQNKPPEWDGINRRRRRPPPEAGDLR